MSAWTHRKRSGSGQWTVLHVQAQAIATVVTVAAAAFVRPSPPLALASHYTQFTGPTGAEINAMPSGPAEWAELRSNETKALPGPRECWTLAGRAVNLTFCSNGSIMSILDTKLGIERLPTAAAGTPIPTLISACTGTVSNAYDASASSATLCTPVVTPDTVSLVGNRIYAVFSTLSTSTEVIVQVVAKEDVLKFRVISVSSVAGTNAFNMLRFLNIPTRMDKCAGTLGAAYESGGFAMAIIPLNAATSTNGNATRLHASRCDLSAQSFGAKLEGAECALWAGPEHNLTVAIAALERAFGLPSPATKDGRWLKSLPNTRSGYLFLDANSTTMEEALNFTARAGMQYLLLDDSTYIADGGWSGKTGGGHYNVSRLRWGNEPVKGLASAIAAAHLRGLRVGLHTMSACVAKSDRYVTPRPDRRLAAAVGDWHLYSRIAATTRALLVIGSATPIPGDVMIEDELLICHSVTPMSKWTTIPETDFRFTLNCMRGAYGTSASTHPQTAAVKFLSGAYGAFLPDHDLLLEIAENLARTVNAVDADMCYFDGLEGLIGAGYPPSNEAAMAGLHFEFWRHLQRSDVLVESSSSSFVPAGSGLWHLDGRSGQSDYCATDVRAYMQYMKEPYLAAAAENLSPLDLGWAGFVLYDQSLYATTPDEMSFLGAKAIGWSGAPSIQTNLPRLRGNGRTQEAFARLAAWQTVDLPADVRAALRATGRDFELRHNSSGHWIIPVHHHQIQIVDPTDRDLQRSEEWTVQRAFGRSSFGARVRILPATVASNHSANLQLLPVMVARLSDALACGFPGGHKLSAVRAGDALQIVHTATDIRLVSCLAQTLGSSYDLSQHRPLVITVRSDGSAALLVVQLVDKNGGCRNFMLVLSFVGRRVIALPRAATRDIWEQPQLLALTQHVVMPSVKGFSWNAVTRVNVFVTGAKVASFAIEGLTSLKEIPATTIGSALAVEGFQLRLPDGLRGAPCGDSSCADYVECDDVSISASCRSFDANNHVLHHRETSSFQEPSKFASGVHYTSASPARAEVTLIERDATAALGPFQSRSLGQD